MLDEVMVNVVNEANVGMSAWPVLPTLMFEVTGIYIIYIIYIMNI